MNVSDQPAFQRALEWLTTNGFKAALIIALAFIGLRVVRMILKRGFHRLAGRTQDEEQRKKIETLGLIVRRAVTIGIIIIAAMTLLKEFGVDIGPILAGAGVLGVAVGFGAQHLVQDVISGFFILLDDQIRVNDVVRIADKSGLVERVSLRTTVLRDIAGNVHYVRNGQIGVVTNMTKDFSRYVFEVGVAYREDVDEVIGVIRAVDEQLRSEPEYRDDILEPIEVLGLDQFADSAVVIKARTKTRPMQQWRVGREFNRRLKKEFDARGIEIPFPHVTLYMGQNKDGTAPPVRVDMGTKG